MSATAFRASPLRTAPRPPTAPRWHLDPAPPAAWADHLAACGGSFFHAPPALEVSLPPGRPVYARLEEGGRVVAIALGVETRCRLARRARHVRFAALPACAPGVHPGPAAAGLARQLAERGAAEVGMDSFGGGSADGEIGGGEPARCRTEHVVALHDGPDALLERMAKMQRRHARRGERDGLSLRVLRGGEAVRALHAAQRNAAGRAAARGDGFAAPEPPAAVGRGDPQDRSWGLATLAACEGEGDPLAVAAVGWAAGRAFYLLGGSSEEGYRRGAAAWLHWKVMAELYAVRFASYDLGGTPGGAEREDHPAHGLFRFKAGFGGAAVACRGARWELDAAHLRLHRLAGLLGGGAA